MINYFASSKRKSPINLAAARVVLGGAIIYKLIMYQWHAYPTWPAKLGYDNILPLFGSSPLFNHIDLVATACLGLVLLFTIGYKVKFTAWVSAVLLTYLGGVRIHWWGSHQTELLFTYSLMLVIFAVFSEEDVLTIREIIDGETIPRLINEKNYSGYFQHRALKWSLVVLGVQYFGAGLYKLVWGTPIQWVQPENMSRYFLLQRPDFYSTIIGELLLSFPLLITIGAICVIVLEIGFLPMILLQRSIWPFFVGLIGFHLSVLVIMGINFFDLVVLFGMFLPWSDIFSKLKTEEVGRVSSPVPTNENSKRKT